MKNFILRFFLVFLLLKSFNAHAQNDIKFDWLASASKYYIGGGMIVKDMVSGADGATVAVGYFTETVDADPGPDTFNLKAKSGEDIFIIKYSKLGKLIYAYSFGASGVLSDEVAKSIAIDNLDNVYITGTFNNTIDFNPGAGAATLSALTSTEIFVLSLDKNGLFRYAINIGDTKDIGKIESGESIVTDKHHNIYVAGTIDGANVDFDPGAGEALETSRNTNIFFAKYDERGNYIFSKVIKGERSDEVRKIRLDKKGNIVLCGDFYSSSLDFDPGTGAAVLGTKGKNDIFFAKYDSVGNYLFAKSIGGIRFDAATSLAIGTDNSIIVTGTFEGKDVDFDAGAGTKLISGTPNHDDNFVTKYDEDGNYIFAFSIVGTYSQNYNDIGVDADNNIFITGEFDGNYVDLDPGPDTYTISTSKSGDYYIAKYTSNGNLLFANSIGYRNQSNHFLLFLNKLLVNENGSITIGGLYADTLDVDTGPGTAYLYAPAGTLYIANYTNDGAYASSLSADNYTNYYNLNTIPSASTVDSAGNIYVTGRFNGRYDFDPGPGVYELESLNDYRNSAYFAKYSSDGKLIFAKAIIGGFNPTINAVVVDKDENIYLTGVASGAADFDPSNGVKYLNNRDAPSDISGYFFAKYNKEGALIFANGEGNFFEDVSNGIAIDSNKNIYITGTFYDKVDFDPGPSSHILKTIGTQDIFFAKYDSSGKFVFAYNIGSPTYYTSALHITLNSRGDIIICGAFNGTAVDFDPGPNKFTLNGGVSGGSAYIAAYKNDGSFIGAFAIKGVSGYYTVELSSLIVDNADNIYISGKYSGSIDFDPSFKTYILKPRSSLFFASYNQAGLFRFVKGITSSSNYVSRNSALNGLASDKKKNIYVAGQFGTDNIDCDPGPDFALLFNEHVDRTNDYNLNLFLAKYDSLGNYKYSYGFSGDSAIGFNSSVAINVDKSGNISYAGYVKTKIDFDPGADSAFLIPTIPNYNLFLAKYTQLPDCDAPNNLFTSAIKSTEATLNWQYSTTVKGFEIQYKQAQQQTWNIAYAAGTARKITVNNLLPAAKYGWKIRASCDNVFSAFSDTVLFTTKPAATFYAAGNAAMKAAANGSHFTIYPNPVTSNLFIKVHSTQEASGEAVASVLTAQGAVAVTQKISFVNHVISATIQLPPKLAPGNYFIKINTPTAEYKSAFIKR